MSEPERTKDDVIKSVYKDKSGFGSVMSTYLKARDVDKSITLKDVKNWFYTNVDNIDKAKGYNSYINNAPYQEYQMDLIFFGKEDDNLNAALSMIDIFSKFAVVIPMKNKEGPTIAAAIMEGVNRMNPDKHPNMIYCDSDSLFTKPYFFELMKETLKIPVYVTKHAPMVVERFNRTFKSMIWKRLKASQVQRINGKQNEKTWRDFVNDVLLTYNYQMVSSVTGLTPNDARKKENILQTKVNLEMHRHSTRRYPEINVGDNVKVFYKKKTQAKKEHLSNWSEEKYKVDRISESMGQKYYHLQGKTRTYLRHDLLKVA